MTDDSDGRTKPGLKQLDEWQTFVDSLDSTQLGILNGMICSRIDYLQDTEIGRQMANFSPGDQVSFVDKKGSLVTGRVFKLNRKTIGVVGDEGGKWKVSPALLSPVDQSSITTDIVSLPAATVSAVSPENDWVFGVIALPGTVESDDDHYVPNVAVWIDGNGLVRHISPMEPGDEADQIISSFEEACTSAMAGPPCTPVQVRTDQVDLIDLFRSQYPKIRFLVGEVPELVDVAEEMDKRFSGNSIPTYAELGISSKATAAFFEATAKLYKSEPWRLVPSELCLIGVSIEALGIENKVISVIGQQGLNFGVLLFESIADHLMYTEVVSSGPDSFDRLPAHSALSFDKGDSIAPVQRKEIMEHGWVVAGSNAYPELFLPVDAKVARHPKVDDLLLFEVLSSGLVALLNYRKEIKAGWNTGRRFCFNHRVSVSDRELDISFSLPATPGNISVESLNELEEMALIDRLNLNDPSDRHTALKKEITAKFEASNEYRALKECNGGHTLLMELGFNYLELTVATCVPADLEEILYELIPRKVMMPPDEAGGLIDDCRAFYTFLKHEYKHPIADECLAILDQRAKKKLRDALADDSMYGVGKSMLSGGEFPFPNDALPPLEMLSQIEPLGDSGLGNTFTKPTKAEKSSRKKKRKASQKSRKKNRR